jgi:predicted transcriptional regulator
MELSVIKIINATFVARTDQVKRRVLPTTITDDVDMVLAFQPCSFKDGYSFFTSY